MFDQSVYTVPEDDPGSVSLCVDIGVEISEPISYTISTAQKSPPEAEGRPCHRIIRLLFYSIVTDSDFTSGTTIIIPVPGTGTCIDFTDLIVNDNIGLEGDEAFSILIDGTPSMAMVTITEDDGKFSVNEMYKQTIATFHSQMCRLVSTQRYTWCKKATLQN